MLGVVVVVGVNVCVAVDGAPRVHCDVLTEVRCRVFSLHPCVACAEYVAVSAWLTTGAGAGASGHDAGDDESKM